MTRRIFGVALTWLAVLCPTAAQAQRLVLYGTQSGQNPQLVTLDPATGAVTSAIGFGLGSGIGAIAVDPITHILYGITAPGFIPPSGTQRQLVWINKQTGVATPVGGLGNIGFNFGIADLAFDSSGKLYGWSENSDDLVTIDTLTGKATVIANAGISTFGSGMSFDLSGTLYLAGGGGNGRFYRLDPTTGVTTFLFNLTGSPFPGFPIPAMKVNPLTGEMFAVNRMFPPIAAGQLMKINTTTGVCTPLGQTIGRLDGIAFDIDNPTPISPPTLTGLASSVTIAQNSSATLPFTISGALVPAALTLSFTSSNTTLLPISSTTISTSCSQVTGACTLRITPENGRAGTATLTVNLTENPNDQLVIASQQIAVTVTSITPNAPAVALANASGAAVALTWTAVDSTPVAYAVAWGTSSGASNLPMQLVPGTATRLDFPALPSGTYFFRVFAVGAGGVSAAGPQTSVTVTSSGVPGPPMSLQGTAVGGGASVNWTAPTIGVTPTLYEVQVGSSIGASDVGLLTTPGLAAAPGLGNGSFWIRTRAAAGGSNGAFSSPIAVTVGAAPCTGAPGVPTMLPVTGAPGQVGFSWIPATGGSAATSYQVGVGTVLGLPPAFTLTSGGSGSSLIWGGTSGSFAASVVATNACGSSAASNQVPFTIQ
jgi:uncharacterized protein DUF6923